MTEPASIIVYRNPGEAAVWEALMGPAGMWLVLGVVSVAAGYLGYALIDYALIRIQTNYRSVNPYDPIRKLRRKFSMVAGIVIGLVVFFLLARPVI